MVETFGNILKNINSGHSPSAKKVIKRAKTYNISAYFILGEGANTFYDKELIKRLEEVEIIPPQEKSNLSFHRSYNS